MPSLNDLKYCGAIEQNTPTISASGSAADNWTTFAADVWFGMRPLNGREYFAARQIGAETTYALTMRYRAGLTNSMRMNYGGRYLYFQDVPDMASARSGWVEIMAVERA